MNNKLKLIEKLQNIKYEIDRGLNSLTKNQKIQDMYILSDLLNYYYSEEETHEDMLDEYNESTGE